MSDSVLRVENLSKKYILRHQQSGNYTALRDVLAGSIRSFRSRLRPGIPRTPKLNREEFWALKDVSFEVKRGEAMGIIGRNGAGKSTLLKILSRITQPTAGQVGMKGRVASLLEVGTGFHPELTGRENIYLNGAILGMTRADIKRKFDEIVDFAEVEKFLDTPVKRYSSGMYVRLAFAVAAHLEPEILVVDEVLAVGDAAFQKKCLGKMRYVSSHEGRTVLFVSHNMTAVKTLCNRAILLDKGRLTQLGEVENVINGYLQESTQNASEQQFFESNSAPGNEFVRIKSLTVLPQSNGSLNTITVKTPLKIECQFWSFKEDMVLNYSLHLFSISGEQIFNSGSAAKKVSPGLHRGVCYIPADLLNDGIYTISMMIIKDTSVVLYNYQEAVLFEVADYREGTAWYGKWPGAVRPALHWDFDSVDTSNLGTPRIQDFIETLNVGTDPPSK